MAPGEGAIEDPDIAYLRETQREPARMNRTLFGQRRTNRIRRRMHKLIISALNSRRVSPSSPREQNNVSFPPFPRLFQVRPFPFLGLLVAICLHNPEVVPVDPIALVMPVLLTPLLQRTQLISSHGDRQAPLRSS